MRVNASLVAFTSYRHLLQHKSSIHVANYDCEIKPEIISPLLRCSAALIAIVVPTVVAAISLFIIFDKNTLVPLESKIKPPYSKQSKQLQKII